jgi:hypothetical protein
MRDNEGQYQLPGEATHWAVDAESHVAPERRHSNIDKVDPVA